MNKEAIKQELSDVWKEFQNIGNASFRFIVIALFVIAFLSSTAGFIYSLVNS